MNIVKSFKTLATLAISLVATVACAELPLDPTHWKITFPVANSSGNALEVLNPTFSDILKGTSELDEELKEYLQLSKNEIALTCEYTGVTTSTRTRYSRTELRQMDGAKQKNWTLDHERKLECRLKVSDLEGGANKLYFMQIHGKKPESKPLLKVIWDKGYVRLLSKNGPELKDFKRKEKYTKVGTEEWFTCAIHASRNSLDIYVNDEKIESFGSEVLDHWPEDNTYYFKAGNYLQEKTPGAKATVTFSSIRLEE